MISKKVGRLEYIEPNNVTKSGDSVRNKIENDKAMPYDLEDLCIAVDFYVLPTSRHNCGNPKTDGNNSAIKYSSKNGSISFFGGSVTDLVDQGGYGDVKLEKRMMTTNFTDVSLINPSGNTSECIGITSINVNFTKNLTPEVTIVFEDVYGASLMLKEELGVYKALQSEKSNDGEKSLTNVVGSNLLGSLFSMPYPIFVLVLKGYFGKPVAYHLSCTGTQVRFSDNNGNFVITCSFIGSLYGSLADIPMTMLSCAPYIENGYSGRKYWLDNTNISDADLSGSKGFFLTDSEGNNPIPMPTFSEMLQQILYCGDNLKKTFSSREEVQEYQKLLLTKKKLEELNFPFNLQHTDKIVREDEWYCRKENGIFYYYFCDVETNECKKTICTEYENKTYDRIEVFSNKVNDLNDSNTYVSLPSAQAMLFNDKYADIATESGTLKKLYPKFFILRDSTNNKFEIIKENNITDGEDTGEIIDYVGETLKNLKRKYRALSYFLELQSDGKTYSHISENATRISIYEVSSACDFRNEIEIQKNAIISEIKARKSNIEAYKRDALVELYGYVPSIENVYDIVFAHLETFMKCFYECLSNIEAKKLTRDRNLGELGVRVTDTDLSPNFASDAPIPPFTMFYGKTIKDGVTTTEMKWPEEISSKLSDLEEVKFINAILNSVDEYQKETYEFLSTGGTSYSNARIPANLYEYIQKIKNPYSGCVSKSKHGSFIYYVYLTFLLRLYYYLSTSKTPNIKAFAKIEFTNFFEIFNDDYSEEVLNNIIELYDTYGVDSYLNGLFGGDIISFDSADTNPYQIGNEGTVFEKTADGGVSYVWHKEKDGQTDRSLVYLIIGKTDETQSYELPIGEFSIKKYYNDFVKNKCNYNINYLNIGNKNNINNRKSYLIVSSPNKILNYYKNKTFSIDTTTGSGEETLSLIDLYFDEMQQYKDENKIYNKGIFQNPKTTTLSGVDMTMLSKQEAIANEKSYFDINKNTVSTAFSKVQLGRNSKSVNNIFQTGIYYNQNKIKIKSIRNCSKAYLFLFSIDKKVNLFTDLANEGIKNGNGFHLLIDLLREGAFYWRMGYMIANKNVAIDDSDTKKITTYNDPILLDDTNFKSPSIGSIYIERGKQSVLYLDEIDNSNYLEIVSVSDNQTLYDVVKQLGVSISRAESLMNLFINWANGDETFSDTNTTFQHIIYHLELTKTDNILDLEGFKSLNEVGILETQKVEVEDKDGEKKEIDKYIIDESHHSVYKSKNGAKMRLSYGDMYISNLCFYMPTDKYKEKDISKDSNYQTYQFRLIELLFDTYFVYDTSVFLSSDDIKKNVTYDNFKSGITNFMSLIKDYGYGTHKNDNVVEATKNKLLTTDLKLSLYIKLKAIYDRWCCNYDFNHWKYIDSSKNKENEYETISGVFNYVDLYFSPIGKKLLVNLSNLATIIQNYVPNTNGDFDQMKKVLVNDSMLNYLSTIADKSNCMFMTLPQKFGGKNFNSMEDVFKPISYNNINIVTDTTTFIVMYKPTLSEHLDNGDEYGDDGYDLADRLGNINPQLPDEFGEYGENGNRVPAFGVTIGKGNQSYFTNITLDTSKSQITDASIAALLNIVNKSNSGGREVISFGQDLYRVFSNYSYAVTVKMLGCAQIMPMMYFQLNNVPLFHGSYMIYNVTHDISNGTFTTTFTGSRVNRRSVPIQPGNVIITNSSDFGLDGEENIEDINTSFWDVNVVEDNPQPSLSNVYSRTAINNAISFVNTLKENANIENATTGLTKIKNITKGQESALISYYATYDYNLYCLQDIDDTYTEVQYRYTDNIQYDFWRGENTLFDASSEQFRQLLKRNEYTTEIVIGEAITGDKIEENVNGLHLQDSDVLVYWAANVNNDYITANSIDNINLSSTDEYRGCATFFYGDDNKDGNNSAYHYKKVGSEGIKEFIYGKDYDKMCFLWNVKIYKRDGTPIGSNGIKKNN